MTASFPQSVVFLYTTDLEATTRFYEEVIGLQRVLDQCDCRIWRLTANSFLGFCSKGGVGGVSGVCVTFVSDDVDGFCDRLRKLGVVLEKEPAFNPRYNIYNAFFRDPNGYLLEVQRFLQPEWPSE